MTLIACSRMYNVAERAASAWSNLFTWVDQHVDVELEIIPHKAPASLGELWLRPDLGSVFMCGWPFNQAVPQPQIIVAPIPSAQRYQSQPIYFTDLVVRKDRGYQSLEDTFGGRIVWTAEGSHSGFNALRHHLLAYRTATRKRLYSDSIGPVFTPAASLKSVIEGEADVAPMDSFALDLIRIHEPESLSEITVIDSTVPAPIPPLVAGHGVDQASIIALREAFLSAGDETALKPVLAELGLKGFTEVPAVAYTLAEIWATEALAAGYARPE